MKMGSQIQVDMHDDVDVAEITPPVLASRIFNEYATFEDTGLTLEELPEPTLWRVLVLPLQAKTKTTSGILLAKSAIDAEKQLQYLGQVLRVGAIAGKSERLEDPTHERNTLTKKYPLNLKPMEWIMYGRYVGLKMTYKGIQLLMLNDDEVVAKIKSPDHYEVYL